MSGGGEGEEETTLEFTPTWVVAAVCTVIVALSLAAERLLHYGGKFLKRKDQKPLYEALQKIKEELMLLGFISLLLTVSQNSLTKICVHPTVLRHMLPCTLQEKKEKEEHPPSSSSQHSAFSFPAPIARRLLAEAAAASEEEHITSYCGRKNKVPLLSLEALHHLHIFIFVLAVVHVTFSVLTVVFGGARIRQWKHWEDSIAKDNYDSTKVLKPKLTQVQQHEFIKGRFSGLGKDSALIGWLQSFFKQFYGSVTKSDYVTLRLGFIVTHCKTNPKFNFHKYMIRALEDDFRQVVGISWYLWLFVVIFLLLNINGWHTYFWIAFIPFILLLSVGTKLEHVITQLAHEVAEKHAAIEGDLVVQPSDGHFWFHRPHIVLFLIHFILFQNAFEIAFFFWIWVTYGFDSCIMGQVRYIVPRLVIGVFIQLLCSYSTLPLYALVTQMGTHYKRAIFNDHVQVGLVGWADKVKKKKALKADGHTSQGSSHDHEGSSTGIQLGSVFQKRTSAPEDSTSVTKADSSTGIQLGSVFQKRTSAPEDSTAVIKAEGSN
ncbi:MLO-like protein 1 isoform X2 [Trifolium pratense]|uniref:MLO-like protein 1 isoform X2 n=1 Tax=Trifolium pratense TaxID=57577 RepID=UPI001E6906C2|nr:MLO-like protein 1 isoform X2 [Trifolium pratense]